MSFAKDQPPLNEKINQFNSEPEQNFLITGTYENTQNYTTNINDVNSTQPTDISSLKANEQLTFKPAFTDLITTHSVSNGVRCTYNWNHWLFALLSILVFIFG